MAERLGINVCDGQPGLGDCWTHRGRSSARTASANTAEHRRLKHRSRFASQHGQPALHAHVHADELSSVRSERTQDVADPEHVVDAIGASATSLDNAQTDRPGICTASERFELAATHRRTKPIGRQMNIELEVVPQDSPRQRPDAASAPRALRQSAFATSARRHSGS